MKKRLAPKLKKPQQIQQNISDHQRLQKHSKHSKPSKHSRKEKQQKDHKLQSYQKQQIEQNYKVIIPYKSSKGQHQIKKYLLQNSKSHNPRSPQNTNKSKDQRTKRTNKILKVNLDADHQNKLNIRNSYLLQHKKNNPEVPLNLGDCKSIRDYCIVDQTFVPLLNSNDKRFISGLLSFNVSTGDQSSSKLLKDTATTLTRNRIDKSIMTKTIQKKDNEVNTFSTSVNDANTQYSQRQIRPTERNQEEGLDEVLLKLQFMYLPNDQSFKNLSRLEKEHYSQLLQSIIHKLAISPRINVSSNAQQNQFMESFKQNKSQNQLNEYFTTKKQQKDAAIQQIELNIQIRKYQQLGIMINDLRTVDYTVLGVLQFVTNLFCFIELNYRNELVIALNKVYGLSYKDRFIRIRKNLPVESLNTKKCMPLNLYTQYIQQSMKLQPIEDLCSENQSQEQQQEKYKIVFFRAVFDAINEEADSYRAFYLSQGEPFPWNTQISKSITFYTIDIQSLQVVFRQLRQKMHETCCMLCGIILDQDLSDIQDNLNPLKKKRIEREDRFIEDWLFQIQQGPKLQNIATGVYIELSMLIFNLIVQQCCNQIREIGDQMQHKL